MELGFGGKGSLPWKRMHRVLASKGKANNGKHQNSQPKRGSTTQENDESRPAFDVADVSASGSGRPRKGSPPRRSGWIMRRTGGKQFFVFRKNNKAITQVLLLLLLLLLLLFIIILRSRVHVFFCLGGWGGWGGGGLFFVFCSVWGFHFYIFSYFGGGGEGMLLSFFGG